MKSECQKPFPDIRESLPAITRLFWDLDIRVYFVIGHSSLGITLARDCQCFQSCSPALPRLGVDSTATSPVAPRPIRHLETGLCENLCFEMRSNNAKECSAFQPSRLFRKALYE